VSAAPDEVTSLSATDQGSAGPAAFTTTHWSVVLAAQGESTDIIAGNCDSDDSEQLRSSDYRDVHENLSKPGGTSHNFDYD
jgi:hypothetical protein